MLYLLRLVEGEGGQVITAIRRCHHTACCYGLWWAYKGPFGILHILSAVMEVSEEAKGTTSYESGGSRYWGPDYGESPLVFKLAIVGLIRTQYGSGAGVSCSQNVGISHDLASGFRVGFRSFFEDLGTY